MKYFFKLLIFFLFPIWAFSQSDVKVKYSDSGIDDVSTLTGSPQRNTISEFVEGDVDLYTGRATYGINLYTIKENDLSLPITINYASAGVKVNELASWVGTGWNLNAGGEIVRNLRGLPDEMADKGYLLKSSKIADFKNSVLSVEQKQTLITDIENKNYDLEPDEFYVSCGGYSGKILFDASGNLICIPYDEIVISKTITNNKITEFDITTKQGVKYVFGKETNSIEETKTSSLTIPASKVVGAVESYTGSTSEITEKLSATDFYNSKWYLTKIISPIGNAITLSYENVGTIHYVNVPRNIRIGVDYSLDPSDNKYKYQTYSICASNSAPEYNFKCPSVVVEQDEPGFLRLGEISDADSKKLYQIQTFFEVNRKKLTSIQTGSGTIVSFVSKANRKDMPDEISLSEINITNSLDKPVKSFIFSYDNFLSEAFNTDGSKSDPFSKCDALVFSTLSIPATTEGGTVPACKSLDYIYSTAFNALPNKDLISKYSVEGLKKYNYYRLFLKSITEKNNPLGMPSYEFTYITPEKLQRRTSDFVDSYGYNYNGLITNASSSYLITDISNTLYQCTDGFSRSISNSQYGLLSSVKTPQGGTIAYTYEANTNVGGSHVFSIVSSAPNTIPITKNFNFISTDYVVQYTGTHNQEKLEYWMDSPQGFFHCGSDLNCTDIQKIGYSTKYQFTLTTSYPKASSYYVKSSPIGFSEVEVSWAGSTQRKEVYKFKKVLLTGNLQSSKNGMVYSNPVFLNDWEYQQCTQFWINTFWQYVNRYRKINNIFENSSGYPNPQNTDFGFLYGNIESIAVYSTSGKVKETIFEYSPVEDKNIFTEGLVAATYTCGLHYELTETISYDNDIDKDSHYTKKHKAGIYKEISTRMVLKGTTEKIYDPQDPGVESKCLTKTKTLEYNSYGNIKTETTNQSDGLPITKEYKYPTDLPDWTSRSMTSKNMINYPIEVVSLKNNNVIDSKITKYFCQNCQLDPDGFYSSGLIVPHAQYSLNTLSPIPYLAYTYASDMYSFDSRCKPNIVFDSYDDNNGNLLQYHNVNADGSVGNYNSYIWGYKGQYPIAEVKNAKKTDIAVLDFESNSNDWNDNFGFNVNFVKFSPYAHTGKYCGLISGNVNGNDNNNGWLVGTNLTPSNQDGKYLYSAWVKVSTGYPADNLAILYVILKNSNGAEILYLNKDIPNIKGWQYIEIPIDLSTVSENVTLGTIFKLPDNVSIYVDDIRFRPADAQMTTYTYEPLVGMTSVTDANNKSTSYEYDALGRLKRVRDFNKNLLKENIYNNVGSNNVGFWSVTPDDDQEFLYTGANDVRFDVSLNELSNYSVDFSYVAPSEDWIKLKTQTSSYFIVDILEAGCSDREANIILTAPGYETITIKVTQKSRPDFVFAPLTRTTFKEGISYTLPVKTCISGKVGLELYRYNSSFISKIIDEMYSSADMDVSFILPEDDAKAGYSLDGSYSLKIYSMADPTNICEYSPQFYIERCANGPCSTDPPPGEPEKPGCVEVSGVTSEFKNVTVEKKGVYDQIVSGDVFVVKYEAVNICKKKIVFEGNGSDHTKDFSIEPNEFTEPQEFTDENNTITFTITPEVETKLKYLPASDNGWTIRLSNTTTPVTASYLIGTFKYYK